jgi:hypothetical protein
LPCSYGIGQAGSEEKFRWHPGFPGTELIERGIPFKLQGEAKLEIVDKSVRCTIMIPERPEHFTFGAGVSTGQNKIGGNNAGETANPDR